jgi:hypothetical protein
MIKKYLSTSVFAVLILFVFVFGQTALSISKSTPTPKSISSSTLGSPPLENITTVKGNETLLTNNTLKVQNIRYIEATFEIIDVNKTDSHAGIVWSVGNQNYYAFLRPSTSRLSAYTPDKGEFLSAEITPRLEKGVMYTLKIGFASDGINIFLNNMQKIHIPQNTSFSPYLFFCNCFSKVGIRSYNSIAQFEPVKIVGR